MKDKREIIFRVGFAALLIAAAGAYAYFFYPAFGVDIEVRRLEYQRLEEEKEMIAGAMVNPDEIRGDIERIKSVLARRDDIGGLNRTTLAGDIAACADELGVKINSISIGTSETTGEAGEDGEQLLSVPAEIVCTAPYDGGMYFIGGFEKSAKGTYRIEDFSFVPAGSGTPGELGWKISLRLLYYGEESGTATFPSVPGADEILNGEDAVRAGIPWKI
ncbi:MAG: hypothetical protein LBT34_02445 [Clostridiales Family XIII bacterium]|jgi:hypothetical protein|nr:hypothetical protein [Clostridiales Family XIII bacterium]